MEKDLTLFAEGLIKCGTDESLEKLIEKYTIEDALQVIEYNKMKTNSIGFLLSTPYFKSKNF